MSLMKADWPLTPLKFEKFTDINTTVVLLNPPVDAVYAYINVQGGDLRWRDDGNDPTATVGHLLNNDDDHWYTGDLKAFRMIEDTGSGAQLDVTVSYYKPVQASDGQ